MSMYTHIYGAAHPGDYGIAVTGRRAVVVRDIGGRYIDEAQGASTETGRTGRQAAEKLAARLGWHLDGLSSTHRVW